MQKTAKKIVLKDIRGTYVYLRGDGAPARDGDSPDRATVWEMGVIIGKDHPQLKELWKAVRAVAKEAFGANVKAGALNLIPRDGDETKDSAEYANSMYFTARTWRHPGIIMPSGAPASEADLEAHCYSGAYYSVSLTLRPYDHPAGGKGVRAELNNVLLLRDGERLDGGGSPNADFGIEAPAAAAAGDFADDDDDDDDDLPF